MNSFALEATTGRVFEWGALCGSEREHARAPVFVSFPNLFNGREKEKVEHLASGMFHVLALTTSGRVFAWGKGDYGQLGVGRPGNWDAPRLVEALGDADVVAVHAGGWHSAALCGSGACFAWGRGEYGRLGMGEDQADKQRPTLVTFPPFTETREMPLSADSLETQEKKNTLPKAIVDVALGGSHSCFLDSGGAVWTVGRNNHGRLGRVVHGKWTGTPGRVVFPPPRGGGEWACESVVAGGRHTLAVARAV
jgi:alpha-tubulin suppressor-like RCC1 family protein